MVRGMEGGWQMDGGMEGRRGKGGGEARGREGERVSSTDHKTLKAGTRGVGRGAGEVR